MKDIPLPIFLANQANAKKLQYAFAVEYNLVMMTVKVSFIWSLQRLRSRNIWLARSLWGIQVLNMLSGLMGTLINAFPCRPIAKVYNPTISGTCLNPLKIVIACVTSVLVTDLMVLIMPTWIIYDLKMSLKKKMLSIAFLSIGAIVMIVGILRLIWLTNIFKGIFDSHSVEQAYSAIESNVAIIGASGPTVKYILSLIFPCLRSKAVHSSSANAYGYKYGSSSAGPGNTRPHLSKYQSQAGYDDLRDSESLNRQDIEMKGTSEWKWVGKRGDEDAQSDEQRIAHRNDGIVKTVNWTVSSTEERTHAGGGGRDVERAVQPANVV